MCCISCVVFGLVLSSAMFLCRFKVLLLCPSLPSSPQEFSQCNRDRVLLTPCRVATRPAVSEGYVGHVASILSSSCKVQHGPWCGGGSAGNVAGALGCVESWLTTAMNVYHTARRSSWRV